MKPLTKKWSAKDITIPLMKFGKDNEKSLILALNYIGQEFIRNARTSGTYTDHTGNLRSSIGYAIYKDGKELKSYFNVAQSDNNGKGVSSAKGFAKEKVSKKGLNLIVVAGMEYAEAVESKGKDVLTIYAPTKNRVENDLRKLLKYV